MPLTGSLLIDFNLTHLRDLQGRFVKAQAWLNDDLGRKIRVLSERWVELAKAEAPVLTGTFAAGIRSYVTETEGRHGFVGIIPQPLGEYIIEGTKEHEISARNSSALWFYSETEGMNVLVPKLGARPGIQKNRRNGEDILVVGKGYVTRKATAANRFTERALDALLPETDMIVNTTIQGWRTIVTSGD